MTMESAKQTNGHFLLDLEGDAAKERLPHFVLCGWSASKRENLVKGDQRKRNRIVWDFLQPCQNMFLIFWRTPNFCQCSHLFFLHDHHCHRHHHTFQQEEAELEVNKKLLAKVFLLKDIWRTREPKVNYQQQSTCFCFLIKLKKTFAGSASFLWQLCSES